jgi:signal transduction histidine kinase
VTKKMTSSASEFRGGRVLVVDDERDLATILAATLEVRGYQVEVAHDAQGALQKAKELEAQVALLDVRLGSESGTDLIAELESARPGVLCVVMTGYAAVDSAIEAIQRGAYDYLVKPLDMPYLLTTLDRCFDKLRLEREKAAAQEALEAHIAELERANAELRHLDMLREQFIQNVAHELRTPLALIHGYVEMLAQGELQAGEQHIALSVTSRRVRALVDLVESITILQDLERQPLRLEPILPHELTWTAHQMAAQRAHSKGIRIEDGCPHGLAPFHGDFTRLAQALHQLLDNSIKFSPEGSAVTMAARGGRDGLEISVSDQGAGISTDKLAHIFDRFYQADGSMTRQHGGTGLGLAIAKEVVEAHGGRISVESEPGQGSTFTVFLPAGGPGAE